MPNAIHPVAVLTPDKVRERAERALPEAVSLLVADSAGAGNSVGARKSES